MSYYTQEIIKVGIFALASSLLALLLLALVFILNYTSKVEMEKSSAYECGFSPFNETLYPFEVQFAIVALIFLLFDIEVLYLFPLVVSLYSLSFFSLSFLLIFFLILTLGIIIEVTRNVLNFVKVNSNLQIEKKRQSPENVLQRPLTRIEILFLGVLCFGSISECDCNTLEIIAMIPCLVMNPIHSQINLCPRTYLSIIKRFTGRTPKDVSKLITHPPVPPVVPPLPPINYGKRMRTVVPSSHTHGDAAYKPIPRSPEKLVSVRDKVSSFQTTPPQPPTVGEAPNTNWGSASQPGHIFKRNAPGMGYTIVKPKTTPVIDSITGQPITEPKVVTHTGQPIPQHEATHAIVRDNETGLDVGVLTSAKKLAKGNLYVAPENYKGQTLPDGSPKPQYFRPYETPRYSMDASNMVEDPEATAFANTHAKVLDGHIIAAGTAKKIPVIRLNEESPEHHHENGLPIYDSKGKEIEYGRDYETPPTNTTNNETPNTITETK